MPRDVTGARILVVDDEPDFRIVLTESLNARGFVVEAVGSARECEAAIPLFHPDIVLLDLMLPDGSGTEVIARVRDWSRVPIIVLSIQDSEPEKVRALDLGANDYVTKPFGIEELVARIRVALRSLSVGDRVSTDFRLGDLVIDFERRRVTVRGRPVSLAPMEYAVLKALAQNAGRILTYGAVLREVWGPVYETEDHYVHVYIGRLRRKVEADPARPTYILTEPGVGYRLDLDAD